MKLYLSSYRIPTPRDLEELIGKPLNQTSVALIANAQDYFSERARNFFIDDYVKYLENLGLSVDQIDLREFESADLLKERLKPYDLIWAMGGNTYILRYEMHRSKFDEVIQGLLEEGKVYGGYSAGALVAGISIAGVELADEPSFAEEFVEEGLNLVPFVILPHVDDPEFANIVPIFNEKHKDKNIILLKDSQAVVFNEAEHKVVEAV